MPGIKSKGGIKELVLYKLVKKSIKKLYCVPTCFDFIIEIK